MHREDGGAGVIASDVSLDVFFENTAVLAGPLYVGNIHVELLEQVPDSRSYKVGVPGWAWGTPCFYSKSNQLLLACLGRLRCVARLGRLICLLRCGHRCACRAVRLFLLSNRLVRGIQTAFVVGDVDIEKRLLSAVRAAHPPRQAHWTN